MGRLLWFFAGTGAAAWWIKYRNERRWQSTQDMTSSPIHSSAHDQHQSVLQALESRDTPGPSRAMQDGDAERMRLADSMLGIPEASLDTLMLAFETLKDKLTEKHPMPLEHKRLLTEAERHDLTPLDED